MKPIDELHVLEQAIRIGRVFYGSPGFAWGEWHIAADYDALSARAQRIADVNGEEIPVFRLISPEEAGAGESFLFVRRILESGSPQAPYVLQWALTDTRDAAELLGDVSAGPAPYFGIVLTATRRPALRNDTCSADWHCSGGMRGDEVDEVLAALVRRSRQAGRDRRS